MIKQRISIDYTEEFVNEYPKLIGKYAGACDEVWLDWLRFRADKELVDKHLSYLKVIANKLREQGIKVSIEITALGHRASKNSNMEYPCTDFSVGGDGVENTGVYCWRSEKYRKILGEEITMVCRELKPYAFYFDDDLRIANFGGSLRCFCDNCIKEFNEQNGTNYTREQLNELVHTDINIRKKYVEFSYQGIAEFSFLMGKAIVKGCPDTLAGVEHGGYNGECFVRCLEALHKATGKNVCSRSGAGSYTDVFPTALTDKAIETQFQLSMLPDYVSERCNEIENFPSFYYSKTPYGTCLEASVHMASGFNCTSIVCERKGLDTELFEDVLFECSKRRKYWEKLCACNKIGVKKAGLQIYIPQDYWSGNQENYKWMIYPARNGGWIYNYWGVPITFSKMNSPVYYLDKTLAEYITEEEIQKLASLPVATSGSAIEILQNKGFAHYLGIEVVRMSNYVASVNYTAHPLNHDLKDRWWGQALFGNDNHNIIDKSGKVEPLCVYGDGLAPDAHWATDDVAKSNIADAIITTKFGAKWYVQGYRSSDDTITWDKRTQIVRALNYIGGGLKAELVSRNRLMLSPLVDKDEKVINVSLVNTTIAKQNDVEIIVRDAVSENAVLLNEFGENLPLEISRCDDGLKIKVKSVDAWSILTVFFN